MNLALQIIVLLLGIYTSDAGYGVPDPPSPSYGDAQSDVQAPAYMPPYLRNQNFAKTSYSRSYSGQKTAYSGTKTGYAGTKTGYAGTKTGYAGTKTGYSGTKSHYGEKKTWYSDTGMAPTFEEFQGHANEPYTAKCNPECKNNGICVDTNTCQCPLNFHGQYCEFEKKPCLVYPPMPMNSRRNCSSDFCTVQCQAGYKFIDGSTIANMRCLNGQWQPTRADFTAIPDCLPECNPPCQNGGVCLALNTCQCPENFRGPNCQYSASVCDMRKLAFNGGYSCFGDEETFSCKLKCPTGSAYSTPPAPLYTCRYSTGVFEPQPIPHCVFNDVVIITPNNYQGKEAYGSHSWNMSYTSHGSSESHSHTQQGVYGSDERTSMVVVQDYTPKGGTCFTWAGAHYKTFDGKIYSFQSPCQHILIRDAKDHKYTVAIRHTECKRNAYCPSELTIYVEDKPYTLSVTEDGSVSFRSTKRLIPVPASLPGIRVSMPTDYVRVSLDAAGVTLKWDTVDLVLVEGTVQLWNNTEGLCGTLDGNPENDLMNKDGKIAKTKTAFASSWQLNKIGDICESNPTETSACVSKADADMKKALQFCTKVFSKEKFRKCSKVMDVSMLLETCQWDYCACVTSLSPEECACNTVAVYAKECLRHGIVEMKSWRDDDTCSMRCPEGKIYKSCGPDAQPSCAFPQLPAAADNSTCVEGCFCPEGLLLESGRCVPRDQCPCRLRNRSFKTGAVIPKDCNTCTCFGGEWRCTSAACGARCSAVGDPHYTTFDGLRYDFMGHCTYHLLKADNFSVQVENVACSGAITEAMNLAPYKGSGKPSCTKAVTVEYEGASIHLKQGGLILVNGKEVTSLPVSVGKIRIRAASSLFVIVQLPIKVDLWWDGNTRVSVDVPPTLKGKTQGLCGTFNLNQKDDFLTPEGDIEQSTLAFANKWKTREFCDDTVMTEPEHPCKANVENKEAAEMYCNKLKSKLFEECHWYVDVSPYYEWCVYDMCACAGDAARCLCPVLGDYAVACAAHGLMVHWRNNVKECELSCTGGQQYTVCADSCVRQCSDVALAGGRACTPRCVEGCACPQGQVLDDNGACVPIGLCPCYHKGMKFDAEYKEVRAGRRERELCTCVGARWECQPATPDDILKYPPAEDLRSNCSANNMEFTMCEIAEPLTCKNMHLPPSRTTEECRPGCQCKRGYVLDTASNRCVLAAQCPCHHGGRSYPDGGTMQEECNTCECKSGNWSCTNRTCAGVCAAWGDSHIITFDETQYDFEGVCTYLLAKGVMDSNDGFDVEIQNVPCGTTGATCSKSVTLKVGGPGSGEVVSLTRDAPLPDTSKLKRIKVREAGIFVFLDVPSLGVSLQWDRQLRVYVKVDSLWQGRVKGLCGNYNSDMRDDFQTPSGGGLAESSALIFADSWKLKPTCPKVQPVSDYCAERPHRREWASTLCGALKRYPFSLCHTEVEVGGWMQRCERDACACDAGGDCACACAALAAYAHACAHRGVVFDWRTQDLCPMQCDVACAQYSGCVSPCPPETCDNTLEYADLRALCEMDACVEGCKPNKSCPVGTVYSNSSLSECVPRAKCKPPCMELPDGRVLLEGELIEEDACHSCRCSKKHKVCTGQPCSTTPPTAATPPHDEPLKCVTGWTKWISRNTPEVGPNGDSIEKEPLPEPKEFEIGSPMCKAEMMKKIECRTKVNHHTPKETGLDVECSLERGLVCRERGGVCPDFEIRVYCECEQPFQCLNASRPSVPHPTNCAEFYECTPDMLNPDKVHTVLKSCAEGTLYNPNTMVCDWPASVFAVRPECESKPSVTTLESTTFTSTEASSFGAQTTGACGPGRVLASCAYPCGQLCGHFRSVLRDRGECSFGQECAEGCVQESLLDKKCENGTLWRDESTCVPPRDCTCVSEGQMIKPGAVVKIDCLKCQCLDNEMHCDASDCVKVETPRYETSHLPIIALTETTKGTTTTTEATTEPVTTVRPTTIEATTEPGTTVRPTTKVVTTTKPFTTTVATTPIIIKNTATPPPECAPDRYKNLLWDEPLSDQAFSASSIANDFFAPKYAELDARPSDTNAGSWSPEIMDKHQYIQVVFPHPEPIYGVVMQGSPIFDQYVTSYQVLYGDDGHVFSIVHDASGAPKIFRGPVDNRTPMKQMLDPPIEARFVRLQPLTWHRDIAVRFELIGCREPDTTLPTIPTPTTTANPVQCTEPLGLAADLPVENIEVSSNNDARPYFRLDAARGWKPAYSTPGEWIMFDFTSPRNITGIKTKGGPSGWVSSYNVMYTSDLSTFNPVVDNTGQYKVFPANFDEDTEVVNEFKLPIHARYLKVIPLKWHQVMEMRIEPIGCFEPYPLPPKHLPVEEAATTVPPCQPCPGVSAGACACSPPSYFDGEECVSRDQCPCIQSFMSYAVGTTFRGSNCDECVCKLGGISDCRPVKECGCGPDLVPKLSQSTCECLCEPCPKGTMICPTSKLCLPMEKWCDGLQDCPDDEVACTTTMETTLEPPVVTTVAHTVAATTAAPVTTPKPTECPKVECPPGYLIRYTSGSSNRHSSSSDLPPPRPRQSYQRYYRGGYGGNSKGGYSKGGYSKGGYSKGGYGSATPKPQQSQRFTVAKPALSPAGAAQPCAQFTCVPPLPPPPRPGSTPPPLECAAPACPPLYTLKLNKVAGNQCPEYVCVPPLERGAWCNMTGRTFNTFDGAEYKYDVCFHILARENKFDAWTVIVRKTCRAEGCQNYLILHQDDQVIMLKPNLMIEYDNYEYTVEQTSKICFQKNSFDVSRLGNGVAIKSRKYNFTVLYNTEGDIKIGVGRKYLGSVDGMCGAYDGDVRTERRLPDGRAAASLEQFARAWAKPGLPPHACHTDPCDNDKQKRIWNSCEAIAQEPLSKCGKVLNLDKWRTICLEKICKCSELVVNGTKRTEDECRCLVVEQLVAECLAADKDLDVASWRIQLDCPATCPPPRVHYECYSGGCEPACGSAGTCAAAAGVCAAGCYCPAGTLRSGDLCVPPTHCRDCTCKGAGGPASYTTFQGDELPYLGNCTYLLSRDVNATGEHKYQIYATNDPCEESTGVTCTKAIHVLYEGKVIHITKDLKAKKLLLTIGDTPVYKFPMKTDWLTATLVNGQDITLQLIYAHVETSVLYAKMETTVRTSSHVYSERTEGVCGACAGRDRGLRTRNHTLTDDVDLFAESWQASPAALSWLGLPQEQCGAPPPPPPCAPPPPDDNNCLMLYNADIFGACHALVEPQPYVSSCEEELCTLNATDACGALERYAAECRVQGVCLDWRTRTKLCARNCSSPLVYRPCVDCERTCDNYDELKRNPGKCDLSPIEGCFCPEGKVRVNNTCIEPTKCFPCDANKEHYAGDEWQEDACTTCSCARVAGERAAHVACRTRSCTTPVCAHGEDLLTQPAAPHDCCPQYICVPTTPQDNPVCEEPKKMECGFGQVLKQKTKPDGCKEFACECKPASECEPLPSENEVEIMEPGMERVVDSSGCCPRAVMLCRPRTCPKPPDCPKFHTLITTNVTGKCCPEHKCELPKDKCVVTLEWEAAARGGERPRDEPEVVLKDTDAVWLDGPCRSCRCEWAAGAGGPLARCSLSECPPPPQDDQFVAEPRPAPFACCPRYLQVACRYQDTIYRVGENWTSPYDACESFRCVEVEEGKLERVTTVQQCDKDCQPGWKYFPAPASSGQCCGRCRPVACVVGGLERPVGAHWASPDHCTNYTCLDVNGTVQVQSSDESCPPVAESVRAQFEVRTRRVPARCCPETELVGCRVGDRVYKEGETWQTSNPCVNVTCARDASGSLQHAAREQACDTACERGFKYHGPAPGRCCGACRKEACVLGELLKLPGETWQSADNCTTYTCERIGDDVSVTVTRDTCPDVSGCDPDNLVNGTCCQICIEKPQSLSKCAPAALGARESVGAVRVRLGAHGACRNVQPLPAFMECRGTCDSGTVYNNQTGSHDSVCECCQAVQYRPLVVRLLCDDGSMQEHRVATPSRCACTACGNSLAHWPTKGGSTKNGVKGRNPVSNLDYNDEIPDIYMRMATETPDKK